MENKGRLVDSQKDLILYVNDDPMIVHDAKTNTTAAIVATVYRRRPSELSQVGCVVMQGVAKGCGAVAYALVSSGGDVNLQDYNSKSAYENHMVWVMNTLISGPYREQVVSMSVRLDQLNVDRIRLGVCDDKKRQLMASTRSPLGIARSAWTDLRPKPVKIRRSDVSSTASSNTTSSRPRTAWPEYAKRIKRQHTTSTPQRKWDAVRPTTR